MTLCGIPDPVSISFTPTRSGTELRISGLVETYPAIYKTLETVAELGPYCGDRLLRLQIGRTLRRFIDAYERGDIESPEEKIARLEAQLAEVRRVAAK